MAVITAHQTKHFFFSKMKNQVTLRSCAVKIAFIEDE